MSPTAAAASPAEKVFESSSRSQGRREDLTPEVVLLAETAQSKPAQSGPVQETVTREVNEPALVSSPVSVKTVANTTGTSGGERDASSTRKRTSGKGAARKRKRKRRKRKAASNRSARTERADTDRDRTSADESKVTTALVSTVTTSSVNEAVSSSENEDSLPSDAPVLAGITPGASSGEQDADLSFGGLVSADVSAGLDDAQPDQPTSAILVLRIDDDCPEDAETVREPLTLDEREDGAWKSFLPPALLDSEQGSRRGALTLAVIILVIVATLTMSYLMRRPNSSGDGVTWVDSPPGTPVAEIVTLRRGASSIS